MIYQKGITVLSFGSCRYYPTCSQYAKEQLLYNHFGKALFLTLLRLLRCNQLFAGGIDYPVVNLRLRPPSYVRQQDPCTVVRVWFIPKDSKRFYVIKAFHPTS